MLARVSRTCWSEWEDNARERWLGIWEEGLNTLGGGVKYVGVSGWDMF